MSLGIGDVLDGKYRVVRRIGEGGMGTVFEGEHTKIRRRVAIKVLSPLHASEENVKRFAHEAQAAGTIRNDHILEVLDIGEADSELRYLVMEYLDGETLKDRMSAQKQIACDHLMLLIQQVLIGLAAAHTAGVIHRDLKPDNLFILREKAGRTDFVKIIDFGVSKFITMDKEAMRVTRAGSLLGTPVYMSPEQARGLNDADHRSDIYSLGVIMYEAIAGRLPFEGKSFHDLLFKIALSPPDPLEKIVPSVDPEVARIVLKAMAKQPNQRFQSAADFSAAVEKWLASRTIIQGSPGSSASWTKSGNRALPDASPKPPSSGRLPESEPSTPSVGTTDSVSEPPLDLGRARPRTGIYAAIAAVLVIGTVGTTIAVTRSGTHVASGATSSASPLPPPQRVDPPPPPPEATEEAAPVPAKASATTAPAVATKPPVKAGAVKPVTSAKKDPKKPPGGAPDFGY